MAAPSPVLVLCRFFRRLSRDRWSNDCERQKWQAHDILTKDGRDVSTAIRKHFLIPTHDVGAPSRRSVMNADTFRRAFSTVWFSYQELPEWYPDHLRPEPDSLVDEPVNRLDVLEYVHERLMALPVGSGRTVYLGPYMITRLTTENFKIQHAKSVHTFFPTSRVFSAGMAMVEIAKFVLYSDEVTNCLQICRRRPLVAESAVAHG